MLEHSVDFAKSNSEFISKTVISTDDASIVEKARELGVECVVRPDSISGDNSPTSEAIQHVLQNVDGHWDFVLTLQPTNPLRPVGILKKAIEIINSQDCDSVFTVQVSHKKLGLIENNRFEAINYAFGQRSQDMKEAFFETGLLYLTKAELIKNGIIFGPHLKPMIVDHPFSDVDIDVEEDLTKAEYYFNKFRNDGSI